MAAEMSGRTVTTQRLLLRPVALADEDAVWSLHSNPATNVYNPAGPMRERSDAAERVRAWAADWDRDGTGHWAIELLEHPGEVIGFGGVRRIEWRGRWVYNVYYRFDPSVWGRGLGTELALASVEHWHRLPERLPLVVRTSTPNIASQRTAAKAGFERRPDLDATCDDHHEVVFTLGDEL